MSYRAAVFQYYFSVLFPVCCLLGGLGQLGVGLAKLLRYAMIL